MKLFKKMCAYLMVFALAFVFTVAILPARMVKASPWSSSSAGQVTVYTDGTIEDAFSYAGSGTGIFRLGAGSADDISVNAASKTITINNMNAARMDIDGDGWTFVFSGTNTTGELVVEEEMGVNSAVFSLSSGSTFTISGSLYGGAKIVLSDGTSVSPSIASSTGMTSVSGVTFSNNAAAAAETPAVEETPATTETPAAAETPAVAETAAVVETAAAEATPAATETPAVTETATTTQMPQVVDTTPATPANVQQAQQVLATAGMPNFTAGGVVGGNGVSVTGVSPITDGAALTQMTDLAARMVAMSGPQGPVTIASAQAMDLNATGSGRVSIAVGSSYAGKVAVIGHYHGDVLYFQQRWVRADGTVDPYFSNFSPVIVLVTNQTSPISGIPTSEPGATALSSKSTSVSSSTAPKTGEGSESTILLIIGMVALGVAIATYRKKEY